MAQDRVIIVGRTSTGDPVAVCVNDQGQLCGLDEIDANIQINFTPVSDENPVPVSLVEVTDEDPIPVSLVEVTDEDPVPVGEIIRTESVWTTLMNAQIFNNVVTAANSLTHNIVGNGALWVHIFVTSGGTPTDIRVLAQFSDDGGSTWWDFEEGLWASLMWEDTDTAADIRKAYLLTCGGQDLVRFRVICNGTTAPNTFTCTIGVRAFRGNFGVAHA